MTDSPYRSPAPTLDQIEKGPTDDFPRDAALPPTMVRALGRIWERDVALAQSKLDEIKARPPLQRGLSISNDEDDFPRFVRLLRRLSAHTFSTIGQTIYITRLKMNNTRNQAQYEIMTPGGTSLIKHTVSVMELIVAWQDSETGA